MHNWHPGRLLRKPVQASHEPENLNLSGPRSGMRPQYSNLSFGLVQKLGQLIMLRRLTRPNPCA